MKQADLQAALESAVAKLPRGLRDHVRRVVRETRRLARHHGIDEERAVIAALGHDLARAQKRSGLARRAKAEGGLPLADLERHGALSAQLLSRRFGATDPEVLAAARYHTTARAGMSALERLVFIADKIEPEKAREELEVAEARRLADESLEAALRCLLDWQVTRAVERGWLLHPDTVAARNELLEGSLTRRRRKSR